MADRTFEEDLDALIAQYREIEPIEDLVQVLQDKAAQLEREGD